MINIDEIWDLWSYLWSYLGPLFFILFIIALSYIHNPEKFERIAIHLSWVLSRINKRFEKKAISKEVKHIIMSTFIKNFAVEEVPEIVIEWGDEDKAVREIKAGKLVIVLKYGKRNRYENIAKALIASIPELLAPEMKAVYDAKIVKCLSTHVARSIAKEYQPVVTAINETIRDAVEEDEELRKLSTMLIEIDDRSLFSRILIPEMIEVAKLRYPHRDPSIDEEVVKFIELLYKLSKVEKIEEPVIYGKYIRVAFVLVARPEKIEAMLEPHVCYVKHVLKKYRGIRSIYILAAGKGNIAAAKALRILLENELKTMGIKFTIQEHEYEGKYKDVPRMKLYVGRIKIQA